MNQRLTICLLMFLFFASRSFAPVSFNGKVTLAGKANFQAAASGPTVIASDNFNRADGGLGTNWMTVTASSATIASNKERGVSVTATVNIWTNNSFADNQYAKGLITAFSAGNRYMGMVARATGTGATLDGYVCSSDSTSGNGTRIYRIDNGVFTSLKTVATTFSEGDSIEIRCSGTTISFYKNGASVTNAVDATYSSGKAGVYNYGVGNIDDWEAGNL